MKLHMQWAALVTGMIILIAGSLGCATMAATSIDTGEADFRNKPILSDEIIAIGRPDPTLAKQLEQPDIIAFIGKKNTYMLYKGGNELEKVSQLQLDGKRMDIDSEKSRTLYQKDKQVWGNMTLTYHTPSDEEKQVLEKNGFTLVKGPNKNAYQKTVSIEGVIYPAIKIPEAQLAQLTTKRKFNLYNPRDAKPPILPAILKAPIVLLAVAADIVLAPVYLGLGVFLLIVGAAGH